MNKNSFLTAMGITVYILIIATIMQNEDRIFGTQDNFFSPIAFLMLFTLSAVTVGGLVLGKPLMLYFDGKKKEAVNMFLQTVGFLAGFTTITLIITAII